MWSVVVIVGAIPAQLSAAVPKDLPELIRPGGNILPEAVLLETQTNAVRAGILRLIERVYHPKNATPLIYPPLPHYRGTGSKLVDVRYRIEKRNIYEEKEVEQLLPVKDAYGNVTGYAKQKVKVRVSDKIVATEDIEVPDADGPLVKQVSSGVGDNTRRLLPRGWYGMNAQGMYLLCHAGLGSSELVKNMAKELERMLDEYQMPDTTWDLAWLAMGFMAASDSDEGHKKRVSILVSRLIDGAILEVDRRDPARGLWGPVCINHQVLARYFQLELELRKMLEAADAAVAAAPQAQKPAKFKEVELIHKALADVSNAYVRVSQQGRRLADMERPFSINEDYVTAGLSHYIYNREIADIDSTAAAAMALQEARRRKALPDAITRDEILGRKVLKNGVRSQDAVTTSYQAVIALAKKDGAFDTGAVLSAVHAYDGIANLPSVPLTTPLPLLLRLETWRSNVSAGAAIELLSGAVDPQYMARLRGRNDTEVITKNRQRVLDIVRAYIASDPGVRGTRRPHTDESDSLDVLEKTKGWPQPVAWKAKPIAELPIGYQGSPRELLEPLVFMFRDATDPATIAASREVAYRLIIEQGVDGEWSCLSPNRSGPMGVSSGEWVYMMGKLARYHVWQAKSDKERGVKDPITAAFVRQGPWTFRHPNGIGKVEILGNVVVWDEGGPPVDARWPSNSYEMVNLDVAESLAALLYLNGTLKTGAVVKATEVAEIKARAEVAKAEHQEALKKLETAGLDAAALAQQQGDLVKAGPKWVPSPKVAVTTLYPLWNSVLAALGNKRVLSVPAPAPPVVAPAPKDAAPQPADAPKTPDVPAPDAPKGKTIDDLIPKEP